MSKIKLMDCFIAHHDFPDEFEVCRSRDPDGGFYVMFSRNAVELVRMRLTRDVAETLVRALEQELYDLAMEREHKEAKGSGECTCCRDRRPKERAATEAA